ncbi:MAG TPA: hypothetical protein VMW24_04090 [Sedimentisphaerales bacterium]|nr:hypothetical protein [Sedimentisphaerales bacterium]
MMQVSRFGRKIAAASGIGQLMEDWPHKNECIRVNYSQDDQTFAAGMKIIAEEVKRAYAAA